MSECVTKTIVNESPLGKLTGRQPGCCHEKAMHSITILENLAIADNGKKLCSVCTQNVVTVLNACTKRLICSKRKKKKGRAGT